MQLKQCEHWPMGSPLPRKTISHQAQGKSMWQLFTSTWLDACSFQFCGQVTLYTWNSLTRAIVVAYESNIRNHITNYIVAWLCGYGLLGNSVEDVIGPLFLSSQCGACKIDNPYLNVSLSRTPTFEWYKVWRGVGVGVAKIMDTQKPCAGHVLEK